MIKNIRRDIVMNLKMSDTVVNLKCPLRHCCDLKMLDVTLLWTLNIRIQMKLTNIKLGSVVDVQYRTQQFSQQVIILTAAARQPTASIIHVLYLCYLIVWVA